MRALNAAGDDATSVELLDRLNAFENYSTTVAARNEKIHGLDAYLAGLGNVLSRNHTGIDITSRLRDALRMTIRRLDEESAIRLDVYRSAPDEDFSVLLFVDSVPSPLDDPLDMTALEGVRLGDKTLCLVANHRFVWPANPSQRSLTAQIIDNALRSIGARSAVLPVRPEDLHLFDGAYSLNAFAAAPISTLGGHGYNSDDADRRTLSAAYDSISWMTP